MAFLASKYSYGVDVNNVDLLAPLFAQPKREALKFSDPVDVQGYQTQASTLNYSISEMDNNIALLEQRVNNGETELIPQLVQLRNARAGLTSNINQVKANYENGTKDLENNKRFWNGSNVSDNGTIGSFFSYASTLDSTLNPSITNQKERHNFVNNTMSLYDENGIFKSFYSPMHFNTEEMNTIMLNLGASGYTLTSNTDAYRQAHSYMNNSFSVGSEIKDNYQQIGLQAIAFMAAFQGDEKYKHQAIVKGADILNRDGTYTKKDGKHHFNIHGAYNMWASEDGAIYQSVSYYDKDGNKYSGYRMSQGVEDNFYIFNSKGDAKLVNETDKSKYTMYYDRQMLHPIKDGGEHSEKSMQALYNLLAIATDKDDKTLSNILAASASDEGVDVRRYAFSTYEYENLRIIAKELNDFGYDADGIIREQADYFNEDGTIKEDQIEAYDVARTHLYNMLNAVVSTTAEQIGFAEVQDIAFMRVNAQRQREIKGSFRINPDSQKPEEENNISFFDSDDFSIKSVTYMQGGEDPIMGTGDLYLTSVKQNVADFVFDHNLCEVLNQANQLAEATFIRSIGNVNLNKLTMSFQPYATSKNAISTVGIDGKDHVFTYNGDGDGAFIVKVNNQIISGLSSKGNLFQGLEGKPLGFDEEGNILGDRAMYMSTYVLIPTDDYLSQCYITVDLDENDIDYFKTQELKTDRNILKRVWDSIGSGIFGDVKISDLMSEFAGQAAEKKRFRREGTPKEKGWITYKEDQRSVPTAHYSQSDAGKFLFHLRNENAEKYEKEYKNKGGTIYRKEQGQTHMWTNEFIDYMDDRLREDIEEMIKQQFKEQGIIKKNEQTGRYYVTVTAEQAYGSKENAIKAMAYNSETNRNGLILVEKDGDKWTENTKGKYKKDGYVIVQIGIPINKLDYRYNELVKQFDAKQKQMLGQSASVTSAVYEKK
jgi:hypothetical protein